MSSRVNAGIASLNESDTANAYTDSNYSTVVGPQIRRSPETESKRIASLTEMERRIIAFIAQGMRDRQIAGRLHLREATVQYYFRSISDKLACADRLELIVYAYWQGLA